MTIHKDRLLGRETRKPFVEASWWRLYPTREDTASGLRPRFLAFISRYAFLPPDATEVRRLEPRADATFQWRAETIAERED